MSRHPPQYRIHAADFVALRHFGSVNHEDRQAQASCRDDLGPRAGATCVFRHDKFGFVRPHQRQIALNAEWTSVDNNLGLREWQRPLRRIDQAQKIVMLWVRRKFRKMHSTDGQQNTQSGTVQGRHGSGDVRYALPIVARFRRPRGPHQRHEWSILSAAGDHRIVAHLTGKRMRRVDHMCDAGALDIVVQPRDAAKASDSHRQGLAPWARDAARQRQRCSDGHLSQFLAKRRGLRRTAKNQKSRFYG